MTKISYSHQISERREYGAKTVNQEMVITINYDPKEDHIEDVHSVDIYQDGVKVAEISKLLDKAEGEPLLAMIEAIEWRQVYYEQKAEEADYREEDPANSPASSVDQFTMLDSILNNAFSHLQK